MANPQAARKVALFGPVPLVLAAGAVITLVTALVLRGLDTWLAVRDLEALFDEVVDEQLAAGRVPELGEGVRLYQGSGGSPGFLPEPIRDLEPGFYRVTDNGKRYRVLVRERYAQRLVLMKEIPGARPAGQLLYPALAAGWGVALVLAWGYGRILRRRMDSSGPVSPS